MANDYWRRRAKELEAEWQARCESELEAELARYFRESLKEIEDDVAALYGRFAAENGLTYAAAKRLIRGQEFTRWRMSLKEYVALAHVNSAILRELNTLAMRGRISRLEKLYTETLKELQRLGERSESAVTDFLTTAYRERYYRGIYDLASVGKLEIPVAKVEPAKLEKVLASHWQGGNYSTRIWKNTEKLAKTLKSTLTSGLHRGLSVQKMAKAIDAEMNSGYKNAERLVRTELNFIQNQSARESMEAAGLNEYEFIATLDNRTSQRCRSLDGTVHLLEEYDPGTNAPPMHPRCRSTISAVINEGTRTAKVKGKNIRVPAEMTYGDFKRVYVDKARQENSREKTGLVNIPSAAVSKLIQNDTNSKPLNDRLKKFVTEEYFIIGKELNRPIAYSYIESKIILNPEHNGWKMYDVAEALTHEITHLIDFEYNISISLADKISETAQAVEKIFSAKSAFYTKMLDENFGANMSVSDLAAALTGNRFHGNYYHSAEYWSEIGNTEREVVANLMTIYYTNDTAALDFIEGIAPLKNLLEEVKAQYELYA